MQLTINTCTAPAELVSGHCLFPKRRRKRVFHSRHCVNGKFPPSFSTHGPPLAKASNVLFSVHGATQYKIFQLMRRRGIKTANRRRSSQCFMYISVSVGFDKKILHGLDQQVCRIAAWTALQAQVQFSSYKALSTLCYN